MNQNKLIRRELRHQFHPVGWPLVVYYLLMNFVVIFWGIASGMINAIISLLQGDFSMNQYMEDTIASLGWGYGLTITIGFVVLLLWKKPAYFKRTICPWKAHDFRCICGTSLRFSECSAGHCHTQ